MIIFSTHSFRSLFNSMALTLLCCTGTWLTASACELASNGAHSAAVQARPTSISSAYSITQISTIALGAAPHGVAVLPDGSQIWVTNFTSLADPRERYVSLVDTQTLTVTDKIQVGRGAVNVIFSADGSRAYVTNELDDTLSVINVATHAVIKTVDLPDRPHGMMLGQDPATGEVDRRLYVASLGDDSISVIDTSSFALIKTVAVGNTPDSPAVTPDGKSIWVTNYGEGEETTLSLVDGVSLSEIFTMTIGIYPHGIKFDPASNGERLYVSVEGSDDVAVIDTIQRTIVTRYAAGNKPHGLGLSPDGAMLWTGDLLSRTSTVIDAQSGALIGTLDTGTTSNPHLIVFAPDGSRAYITDFTGRRLIVYAIRRDVFLPLVTKSGD